MDTESAGDKGSAYEKFSPDEGSPEQTPDLLSSGEPGLYERIAREANSKHLPNVDLTEVDLVQARRFPHLFHRNLPKIDKNGDGRITSAEVAPAFRLRGLSKDDASFLVTLRIYLKLRESNGNKKGVDSSVVMRQAQLMTRALKAKRIKHYGIGNFKTLDADGNGFISKRELNQALRKRSIKHDDRYAISAMRNSINSIARASNDEYFSENDGITLKDLQNYTTSDDKKLAQIVQFGNEIESAMKKSIARLDETNLNLYADSNNPLHSIVPEAVKQGDSGNCHFLAVIAALAHRYPGEIQRMIEPIENAQRYRVHFKGLTKAIEVDAPTLAELAAYTSGGKYGTWPAVLAKAFAQHYVSQMGLSLDEVEAQAKTVQEMVDSGFLVDTMRILTGKTPVVHDLKRNGIISEAELHQVLTRATRKKVPVVAATAAGEGDGYVLGSNGIVNAHGYTVLGYDPVARTVTVRNPWGTGEPYEGTADKAKDGVNDGKFTLPLNEFRLNFDHIVEAGR